MSISSATDPAALDRRWGELERDRARLLAAIEQAEVRLPQAEARRDAAQAAYEAARDAGGGWGADQPPPAFLTARTAYEAALVTANDTAHGIYQNRMAVGLIDAELERVRAEAVAEVARAERLLGALDRLRTRVQGAG